MEYKVFNDSSNFHKFKADMLFQVATASFAKAREILQACNKVTTPENAPFFLLHDDITNWLREIATNLINAKLIPDAFNKDRDAYRKTYKVTFRYTASQFFPVVVAEKVTSKTEQK